VLWIHRLQLHEVKWVVDVGANHGDFSQAANTLFPEAQVLLVEPLPTLHAELQRRSAERGNRWRLATCALSQARGTATLHVDPAHDSIGSLAGFSEEYLRANPASQASRTFACEVRTLDDLCPEYAIRKIDLLKIDVEGFEFEVLEGGCKMLQSAGALIVEVSLVRRAGDVDVLERMLKRLRGAGFHLVELLPSYFAADQPWLPLEFNLLARRG
jgi:FkbM family methyltransferase